MVDVIGTVTANIVPRAVRSSSAPEVDPVSESASSQSSTSDVGATAISSHIRVDNLLDIAILEIRATDTGNVLQQYPTEPQIKAFQRASELEVEQQFEASSPEVTVSEPQDRSVETSDVAVSEASIPAPQQSTPSVDVTIPSSAVVTATTDNASVPSESSAA